LPFKWNHWT